MYIGIMVSYGGARGDQDERGSSGVHCSTAGIYAPDSQRTARSAFCLRNSYLSSVSVFVVLRPFRCARDIMPDRHRPG